MACIRKRMDPWQCQVRRKGFEPRSKTFAQRKDAERWGALQELDLDNLESRGETSRAVQCDLDLATALNRHAAMVRAKTGDHYLLVAMTRCTLAKRQLDEINRTHFIRYRDDRLTAVGPRTVAREPWLIQRTYDLARKEWGFPGLDPQPGCRFDFAAWHSRPPAPRARRHAGEPPRPTFPCASGHPDSPAHGAWKEASG